MGDGLTVFFIVNIFLVYRNLLNKKHLKKIIGIYLANILMVLVIFYMFTEFLNIDISLFWFILAIIFSVIYSFIKVDEKQNNIGMSLRELSIFMMLYIILALISCIILYFQSANYGCSLLVIVLTVQIIINYCIRFLAFK